MKNIQEFKVLPTIPEPLRFLEELTKNMCWSWNHNAQKLFQRMDSALWEASGHNPISFLTKVPQQTLNEYAENKGFLMHLKNVENFYMDWVSQSNKIPESLGLTSSDTIAYLSMEFGIHESLPIFAGGLGILAGDHLKSASMMSMPLVAVGLFYKKGYFRQRLDMNGWQQEEYPETDIYHLPIEPVLDADGKRINIQINTPYGHTNIMVWRIMVGCIPLYLMDSNVPENSQEIRDITGNLYVADQRVRISQEAILGIGGLKLLAALGIIPKVVHMNEGHSAFAGLERLAQHMDIYKIDLQSAIEIVSRTTIFTTHTPVAAGHDEFSRDIAIPVISQFKERLGLSENELMAFGKDDWHDPSKFSMFSLGLNMSRHCNGVSELHGKVARRMWAHLWSNRPENEIPIGHITNGVHIPTFISEGISSLFEHSVGTDWYLGEMKPKNETDFIDNIFEEELWRVHELNRNKLIRECRKRAINQYKRYNASPEQLSKISSILDPSVLTIGFARRFATYKRGALLLTDPNRLETILNNPKFPIQIIFAGKAHPKDDNGKEVIRKIIAFSSKPSVRDKIIFLEDYDMALGKLMVQGCDIWLNTPLRPYEACGTSGMKAALNGAIHLSILDGWWCEGYREDRGWAIGSGEYYTDEDLYKDILDSQSLYNLLETDVVETFYSNRAEDDIPRKWIAKMKASMKMAVTDFCGHRMLKEYCQKYYVPSVKEFDRLTVNDATEAKRVSSHINRLRSNWHKISLSTPTSDIHSDVRVGDKVNVTVNVFLGDFTPDDVDVELYLGSLRFADFPEEGTVHLMNLRESSEPGHYKYAAEITTTSSGRFGFSTRVTPKGDSAVKFLPNLMTWS